MVKYSICIVAYKDYASLEKCLSLVRKREADDYEIIVHDNTPWAEKTEAEKLKMLDILKDIPITWSVLKQPNDGIGFAPGVNCCVRLAKGEYLVFLNPDTEPTGDWLDRMTRGLDRYDYIGCTSDYIAGIQSYLRYVDDPREFVDTKLIIPVCAIIRRDLFLEMGGFDERFFLGCEDLDFSWRMNLAGKRMGIASDVFVHHIGHTGYELTPGKDQIIKDMESKIRAKLKEHYGEKVPTSEELWGCKILATELRPQTLSVCMIVRDSIEQLEILLPCLDFADEIVVVETEPNPVRAMGCAQYYERFFRKSDHAFIFPWADDFAAARNFALSKCAGDYVLWLDADDRLDAENAALIDAWLKKPGNNVALQTCHFGFQIHNTDTEGNSKEVFTQSRLFPRIPGVKWGGLDGCHGYVHETIWESACGAGLQFIGTNIVLKHTGYSDPEVMAQKQERNIRLLKKEPRNPFSLYNLGMCYFNQGKFEDAVAMYKDAFEEAKGEKTPFTDHIRYLIALTLSKMGKAMEGIPYLEGNDKPDAMQLRGTLKIISGDESQVEAGSDLLWRYLKMGEITDVFGSNYLLLRKASLEILTKLGVLA